LIYTILPEGKDLKESKGIPKFTKASDWIHFITPEKLKVIENKIPDNGISS